MNLKFSSKIRMILSYLKYFFTAKHRFGHGIHSPFIYEFVTHVLFAKDSNQNYHAIDNYQNTIQKDEQIIDIQDLGAGSKISISTKRKIRDIARTSSTKKKYGKLLARIVAFYKPVCSIELGTSLGIGTSYLSINLENNSKLYTIEGDLNLYSKAKKHFDRNFANIVFPIFGNFDQVLPELLGKIENIDLVFFDGNHRKDATINYFELCLEKITDKSIFIFDDIHWSVEMEEAWEYIKLHSKTKVCIDLFQIGIVFFRKELSCENFTIRF